MKIRTHTVQVKRDRVVPPMPEILQLIHNYYSEICRTRGNATFQFTMPGLPPSVNHHYKHTRFATRLTPEAVRYRNEAQWIMKASPERWNPKGTTAAIILFESPVWVTKKHEVRKMDVDNRVKPVFDAIEVGSGGTHDESHWQFHVGKLYSSKEQTTVFLFDLGDIVPYYVYV